MAIVNVTPDSFSDGGKYLARNAAFVHCDRVLGEGADILDIGGESTRPGSAEVGWREELARVLPVVNYAVTLGVPVSVDTSRPEVMAEVIAAGADIVNDVRALQRPGALNVVAAEAAVGVCIMHSIGEPATMQDSPAYSDITAEVRSFLAERRDQAVGAGIELTRIVLDPGYGFGKTSTHNLELLSKQQQLCALGCPLLVGLSRKKTLGEITGRPVDQRQFASVAACLAAVMRGASILRVHDVGATLDALRVWEAARLIPSVLGAAEVG